MDREDVYLRIDEEREKQDSMWGGKKHDVYHDIASWLTFMQHYLTKTVGWVTHGKDEEALNELRKVVALGVACFEVHGVPFPTIAKTDNIYSQPISTLK
jgi:hypothetical protein